jgi:hypothetical protein
MEQCEGSTMRTLTFLAFLALIGCTHDPASEGLHIQNQHGLAEPKIQFLGVGGWLLHWRGEGLLLAPSFTNPATLGLLGMPPARVKADNAKIDHYMPPAADVSMILVGHAHYDHLLDVPRIVEKHAPDAKVYGSATVKHILSAAKTDPKAKIFGPDSIIVPTPDQITDHTTPSRPGTWFYSKKGFLRDGETSTQPLEGAIRVMPIESMHAGHIFRHNFIPGEYDTDLDELPDGLLDWRLGEVTLAWMIDLLGEDGRPVYRIHYQDSAAQPTWGFPPLIADSKPVDVEILCGGSWNQVDNYPAGLLRVTRPRLVLLGHWENFFGNDLDKRARTIPLLDYEGLLDRLKPYNLVVPEPFSEVALPPVR